MMDNKRTEIVLKFEAIISKLVKKKSPDKDKLLATWSTQLTSTQTQTS